MDAFELQLWKKNIPENVVESKRKRCIKKAEVFIRATTDLKLSYFGFIMRRFSSLEKDLRMARKDKKRTKEDLHQGE